MTTHEINTNIYIQLFSKVIFLLITLLLAPSMSLWAQNNTVGRCGKEALYEALIDDEPAFQRTLQRTEKRYQDYIKSNRLNSAARNACNVLTIPVVVHIIYDDTTSNISDAQIHSQIDILNQDFRRIKGTSGFGPGVDTEIQFCLASQDPNGLNSTGITRTESFFTNHQIINDFVLKSIISWDDSQYLNIWVVKGIVNQFGDPILGYASMPGMPGVTVSGVVVQGENFGNIGTAIFPYDRGRTTTHEVGHFLGLFHTFESDEICEGQTLLNCLSEGDRVCDTPSEKGPQFGCPVDNFNTCRDFPCDQPDIVSNYMNFVDDACMDHFTRGQADRMRFFLNTSLSSLVENSNVLATGCGNSTQSMKKPEPEMEVSSMVICSGGSISFYDITPGCNDSIFWEFEGGTPVFDSTFNPTVTYAEAGRYKVKMSVVNELGTGVKIEENFIHVAPDTLVTSFAESFEDIFEPEGWFQSGSSGPESWVRNIFTSSDSQASAVLPNFTTASCGTNEDLVTPPVNLKDAVSAKLSFDYAYRQRSADTAYFDRLILIVSDDCGENFNDTIFDRSGPGLTTVPGIGPDAIFLPNRDSDWKTQDISLSKFRGKEAVRIMFRGIGRKGQHLYLDHIQVFSTIDAEELIEETNIKLFPNPFYDSFKIEFTGTKASPINFRLMDINGKKIMEANEAFMHPGDQIAPFLKSDLKGLKAGLYMLEIQTNFGRFVQKIVKI